MLDKKTKEWLERREYRLEKTGYYMSLWDFMNKTLFGMTEMPNWKDCAEFEARVAAKIAVESHNCGYCKIFDICNGICEWERLKYARIEVEEEMDEKL